MGPIFLKESSDLKRIEDSLNMLLKLSDQEGSNISCKIKDELAMAHIGAKGEDEIKYYETDDINGLKLFMQRFKTFPNKIFASLITEDMRKRANREFLDLDFDGYQFVQDIQKKYPSTKVHITEKRHINESEENLGMDTYKIILYVYDLKCVLSITPSLDSNNVIIYYSEYNLIKNIYSMLSNPKYIHEEKITPPKKMINLIVKTQSGYDLIENEIKQMYVDINKHYNDDFKKVDENIVKFLNEESSTGPVILKGEKGTGKTTYIRNLINTTNRRFIYLTNELASALADPTFIPFLREISGSVLIIEDCEKLVASREKGNYSAGIANLLNLCDGLLSDIFNIKIIITFNTDISNIDSALLRKGRLISLYDFGKLSVEKCNVLFEELGQEYRTDEPLVITDVFNHDIDTNSDCDNNKKTIGFGV